MLVAPARTARVAAHRLYTSPLSLAYRWRRIWLRFECFDVPTGWAVVRYQFRHRTDTRHTADRRRAFAKAGAIIGSSRNFGKTRVMHE
jgi:hypothetical protein